MFVVCGEALYDLFAEEAGDGAFRFDARPGGSPMNVAIGLARLGCDVAFAGGVSRDFLGEALVALLAREGVSTELCQRLDAPTTLSLVGRDAAGHPSYAFRGEGAADRMTVQAPDLPDAARALHLGSYSAVVEPVGSALLALARREAGRRIVSYDANVRPGVEPDMDIWRRRFDALLPTLDILKMSDEDFSLLFGGADEATLAASWLSRGPALVVVTCGARGARAYGSCGAAQIAASPVEAVDTVGAGDSFMAALLCRLADGGLLDRAALDGMGRDALTRILGEAAQAAAMTCGRRGADPPRRCDLPGWARNKM